MSVNFTFLCRCDRIDSIEGEQEERRGELIAKQPKLLSH